MIGSMVDAEPIQPAGKHSPRFPRFLYRMVPMTAGSTLPFFQQLRWIQRYKTAMSRTLPDFIIIGAQRAGTTSLYNYLIQHPCIRRALRKEVHYFDIHHHHGEQWYRAHFMPESARKAQPIPGYPRITGEASPYYLFHPLVPERAKALVPNAKLIVILRNPATRALSQYFFQNKIKQDDAGLEEAFKNEEQRMAGAELDGPRPRRTSIPHRRHSYLQRGIYVDQLERWFQHFPREQFQIINSERMLEDPATEVGKTFQFLGLPDCDTISYEKYHVTRYPKVDPAIKEWLADYFRPHNERLYQLLGERYDW